MKHRSRSFTNSAHLTAQTTKRPMRRCAMVKTHETALSGRLVIIKMTSDLSFFSFFPLHAWCRRMTAARRGQDAKRASQVRGARTSDRWQAPSCYSRRGHRRTFRLSRSLPLPVMARLAQPVGACSFSDLQQPRRGRCVLLQHGLKWADASPWHDGQANDNLVFLLFHRP